MKKKKLKKKLKSIQRQLGSLKTRHYNVAVKVSSLQELRNNMKDTINDLNELMADIKNKPKDNRINILWEWLQRSGIDFHDWGRTPVYAEEVVYTEDIQRQINELKSLMHSYDSRLSVLDARSRVDYTLYCTNGEVIPGKKVEGEKTCDTCKWKPLLEQGGQDIPCMGCTADDKKMWKSKEA